MYGAEPVLPTTLRYSSFSSTITMMCGGPDALDVDVDVEVVVVADVVVVVVAVVELAVEVVEVVDEVVDDVVTAGVTSRWGARVVPALELAKTAVLAAVTANE